MKRGAQKMQARLAKYARLRDEGMLPVDAARELGISYTTRMSYERRYRAERGLPPGHPRASYGEK